MFNMCQNGCQCYLTPKQTTVSVSFIDINNTVLISQYYLIDNISITKKPIVPKRLGFKKYPFFNRLNFKNRIILNEIYLINRRRKTTSNARTK